MTRLVALIPSGRRLGAGLSPLQLQPDRDRRLDMYQAAAGRVTGKSHSPHGHAMTFHVRESDGLESLRAHERSRSGILRPPTNCSRGPSNISSPTILRKIYRMVDPTSFVSFLWFKINPPTPPTPFLQHCTGRSIEITHSHVVPRPINLRPSRKYSFATTALVIWSWASHSVLRHCSRQIAAIGRHLATTFGIPHVVPKTGW